jgi:maspardin
MTMTSTSLGPIPASLARLADGLPLREFRDSSGRRWCFRDSKAHGPVLVLLPGAAGGADVAFKLVDALRNRVRTISITYPSGARADDLADGLLELLDHLGVGTVAVWGSSYGAWWAQSFAARHADRVAALWLGNTFVDAADVVHLSLFDRRWLQRSTGVEVQRTWLEAVADQPPGELRDLQSHFIEHALTAEELRARLLEVATSHALPPASAIERTVVSDCADDPIIGERTRKLVVARYPRARHVRLPSGGHYPHLTNSEALVVKLRRWLEL